MNLPNLGNALCPPDGCHAALVPIGERPAWHALHPTADLFRNILAHLDGYRSHSWNWRAVLLKVCEVADDKDLRMSFDVQSIVHDDPTAAIGFAAERLT